MRRASCYCLGGDEGGVGGDDLVIGRFGLRALCIHEALSQSELWCVVSGRVLKVHRVMISLGGCFGDRIKSRPGMY